MQSQHFYYVYFRQTTRFLKFRFWLSPGPSATQCQPWGPGTEDDYCTVVHVQPRSQGFRMRTRGETRKPWSGPVTWLPEKWQYLTATRQGVARYSLSNVYNMSGRVVSDIQTRAEGESLYIRHNTDANVVNNLKNDSSYKFIGEVILKINVV
jgi:hypothetical protein